MKPHLSEILCEVRKWGEQVSRKRVHQVAKGFKISSEALLELLHSMNIPAKSHMSTVEDETVDMVRKHFEVEKAALREEYAKKEREIAKRRELPKPVDREGMQKKTPRHKRGFQPRDGRVKREAVEVSVKRVMAMMDAGVKAKKRRRKQRSSEESTTTSATPESSTESPILKLLDDSVTVGDFAKMMQRAPADVIKACMDLGLMVSINQRLDADTAEAVADEMGLVLERSVEHAEEEDTAEHIPEPRPPAGHRDGACRSWENLHSGLYPTHKCRGRRTRRDYPTYGCLRSGATRGANDFHRHARPQGLYRYAGSRDSDH